MTKATFTHDGPQHRHPTRGRGYAGMDTRSPRLHPTDLAAHGMAWTPLKQRLFEHRLLAAQGGGFWAGADGAEHA